MESGVSYLPRGTYGGHEDGGLAHFMSGVFEVANFLVHVVNNFEILRLLTLVQRLQVSRLLSFCGQ